MKRAESIRVMHPLFQEGQGGSIPTSALVLRFDTCSAKRAIELNRLWHSRLPVLIEANIVLCTLRVYYVAAFDGKAYAVAVWTSPTAYLLPQDTWIELRRFAISDDAPPNTASRMLAWMARDIRRRFPKVERLISYQDTEVHTGCIYRAAGWCRTVVSNDRRDRGKRSGRVRNASQTTAVKQRWEKRIIEAA